MKVGAVILARLDSRRLPGKAMRELKGRPLIQYAFDACIAARGVDQVILATTEQPEDNRLAQHAESQGISCFRGSVDDVSGRFLAAMECHELDAALRYNGDSPLNRPNLLADAIASFRTGQWDLVTNVPGRTYPFGISAEVVGRPIMKAACAAMTEDAHREHVTKFFYDYPSFARIHTMRAAEGGMSGLQLAVDSAEDLARAEWILGRLRESLLDAPLETIVALGRAYDINMGNSRS